MTSPTLLSLADRCEKLTGPCRETDARIQCALDGHRFVSFSDKRGMDQISTISTGEKPLGIVLTYTGSLDAAMTLLPPNHRWLMNGPDVDGAGDDIRPCAVVMPYGVSVFFPGDTHQAATPVLAFLSAVLRARSALEANHG